MLPPENIVKPCKMVPTYARDGHTNGWLLEVVSSRDSWTEHIEGQVYLTVAYPGELKGYHVHRKKVDHFTCVCGRADVLALVDGEVARFPMVDDGGSRFTVKVPAGYPHAIENTGEFDAYVINYCWPPYDPEDPDQEELEFA